MVTDHAHIIALNRFTGELLWETEMADWHQNYNATSAPLVVGDLVVSGTRGRRRGRARLRGRLRSGHRQGSLALLDRARSRASRARRRGRDSDLEHPGSVTWFTGSYDPELDTVYWQTGNPGNDLNGDDRGGDNLYSGSILALDAKTGKLKWYYQFTPHDVWDWDATEPAVLVDTVWQGQPRKLLLQANRNGFFYVLDRINGKLLLAKPFVKKLTWAKEIGADGRPVVNPEPGADARGQQDLPGARGRHQLVLDVVQSGDRAVLRADAGEVRRLQEEWLCHGRRAKVTWAARRREPEDETAQKILRAIDIQTGKIVWELPEAGPGESWGGTLATAGGIVIFGEDSGALAAADAKTGKALWRFQANRTVEGVADDVCVRRQAVCGRRVGIERDQLRTGGVARPTAWLRLPQGWTGRPPSAQTAPGRRKARRSGPWPAPDRLPPIPAAGRRNRLGHLRRQCLRSRN